MSKKSGMGKFILGAFFYNSVMGYMSVANALIYFAAMDNPEETNKRRGRLSEVRSAIGSIDFVKDSL